ncbi:MAG: hypothetical protein MHMPM18_003257 [Marteilia pararefringens]
MRFFLFKSINQSEFRTIYALGAAYLPSAAIKHTLLERFNALFSILPPPRALQAIFRCNPLMASQEVAQKLGFEQYVDRAITQLLFD